MIKVKVEETKNPNFRKYFFNKKVAQTDEYFTKDMSKDSKMIPFAMIGKNGEAITEGIFSAGNIIDIFIYPEEIYVLKEEEGEWSKIEEEMMIVLSCLYGGSKFSFWPRFFRRLREKLKMF
ncbi:NifU N-terminal domain-containing protein [Candidatus Parcubacteria bacterium]|nr:NifU N-terminal domain-containing protein [Candidatus Parcubacteria bacterium]